MNIQLSEVVKMLRAAHPEWPFGEPLYIPTAAEPTPEGIARISADRGAYVAETRVCDCADGTDLVVDFDHEGRILGVEVLWA